MHGTEETGISFKGDLNWWVSEPYIFDSSSQSRKRVTVHNDGHFGNLLTGTHNCVSM